MSRFGKVAVLYGGWSEERPVSLESGAAVHAALQRQGVDAHLVDATPERILNLPQQGFERVFIALHGRGGEDGRTQAALEFMGLPYTGSDVGSSALAMDKWRTKLVWQARGLPTPAYRRLQNAQDAEEAVAALGLPLFVKPAREGSSIGLSKVSRAEDMGAAFERALQGDSLVIAERGIQGGEYTAAMLAGQPLPLIQILPATEFYDYAAKYTLDSTRYQVPEDLGAARTAELQALCMDAFAALGCSGWGRVDFMLDADGQPWLLEANTAPGMTSHSLVPMAARAAGLSFEALVLRILETTLEGAA